MGLSDPSALPGKRGLLDGSGSGWFRRAAIREGLSLACADIAYQHCSEDEHGGPDSLKFHFKLSGHSGVVFERKEYTALENGQVLVLIQPHDSVKCERVEADAHERCLTFACERDFVASILSGYDEELPRTVTDFLSNRVSWFAMDSFPMTPQMRCIVEDILRPPGEGPLYDLAMEGKALELLCETVRQMVRAPTPYAHLSSREIRKVRDICALLTEQTGMSLSIAELSRLFAWNDSQMMAAFKQVTGMTVSTYRQRNRLEFAKRQLCESEASISEIAFDAGYEHPANFATAFKRVYGYSPSSIRGRSS